MHMSEIIEALVINGQGSLFVSLIRINGKVRQTFCSQLYAEPSTMRQPARIVADFFLAIGHDVGKAFGLPFCRICIHMTHLPEYPVLAELKTNDLRYDSRSAFTLSLNHRETYTGITDHDRALTTRKFAELDRDCL